MELVEQIAIAIATFKPDGKHVHIPHTVELAQHIIDSLPKMTTKLFGPNLEELLSSAGFRRSKPWIGLTNEEVRETHQWIEFMVSGRGLLPTRKLIAHVEAKLKEKNA